MILIYLDMILGKNAGIILYNYTKTSPSWGGSQDYKEIAADYKKLESQMYI